MHSMGLHGTRVPLVPVSCLLLPSRQLVPHDSSMGPIPLGVLVRASLAVSALASALTSFLPPSPVFDNAALATCSKASFLV